MSPSGTRFRDAKQPTRFDKARLLASLLEHVRDDLASLERSQSESREAATHVEHRAEHAKDTRSTEQSYLARGLAERVETLREQERRLAALELPDFVAEDAIALCAIATIEDEDSGAIQTWWLVPAAGGTELDGEEVAVRTVTPASPLGRALVGLECGDDGAYHTPRGTRRFHVLEIE